MDREVAFALIKTEGLDETSRTRIQREAQARFRLFDSITSFLKGAGQRQPLVLVLDDLHWADTASLMLLQFIARELTGARVLLVGTYRDVEVNRQHPLAETLGEVTRSAGGGFERILLRGLSQEDVGRFIGVTSGLTPPSGLVQAVHTQTEGNPLFVTEVVRLLVQQGDLTGEQAIDRESWEFRVPEGVKEVIGRRLNRLSQRCNEVLSITSAIGREFTLEQVDRLMEDLTQDMLLDVLEEALHGRLVEEMPTSIGRYQFTHALIQETLAQELTITRRVRLHARIAEVLEELYGSNAEAHAAELVHHYVQAEAMLGSEKLVHYSLLAGERALTTYAHEEALAHFQRALAAKEGLPMEAETAALLFGLARAQLATLQLHQLQEAVTSLSRVLDYYAEAGDVDRAVAVAEYPLPIIPGLIGATQLIPRALALVPPDSQEAGRLLSQYGSAMGIQQGDYEGAQEPLGRALAIAQGAGDVTLEMGTLVSSLSVDLYHFHWREGLPKSLRAIELAIQLDYPSAEVVARAHSWCANYVMGVLGGAQPHVEGGLTVAERLRDSFWLTTWLFFNAVMSRLDGDWQAAREYTNRGLAIAPQDIRLLLTRVRLEYEVGDVGQGEAYKDRLREALRLAPPGPSLENGFSAVVIPSVARTSGFADWLDIAEACAQTVLSSPSATYGVVIYARTGLALTAVQRGDVVAAEELYAALEPVREIYMIMFPDTICIDRLLGLLSVTLDRLDQAVAHFGDALAFCRRVRARPDLAWSCCDYADALLERNGAGDRAKAITLLDESLAISSELGMRPLMERVLSRLEILRA